jgi:phage terminase large subunit-like protein
VTAFRLTDKQAQALKLASGPATHVMLEGGGRSGKTFVHLRNVVMRALKAQNSRHIAARFRFNHIKTSMIADTFPKVMRLCFPQVKVDLSRTDWFARFPNKSELWFAGLDDKERTEKILGMEFATIYLNESSEIPWHSRQMVMTRLAQKAVQLIDGVESPLKLRVFYDCNPPSKAHWTFRLFHQKQDPETRDALANPLDFARMQMNPRDNLDNISPEYLTQLAGLGARMRRRFEFGEYAEAVASALFDEAVIDRWRVLDGELPDMVRKVVAVDPSGSGDEDNADNDEIGIAVAGLGTDGRGYVLEDDTVKGGPGTWGRVAVNAYQRHAADALVGETNFGGDMVRATIAASAAEQGCRVNFKKVTASRGKAVRAEPFSALYEQGKVRHVGLLPKLEDELCAMSTTGYLGSGSPNRADAAIWALAELFPGMVAGPKVERVPRERAARGHGAWMA